MSTTPSRIQSSRTICDLCAEKLELTYCAQASNVEGVIRELTLCDTCVEGILKARKIAEEKMLLAMAGEEEQR